MLCHVSPITEQAIFALAPLAVLLYSDCFEDVQVVYPAKLSGSAAIYDMAYHSTGIQNQQYES